MAEASSKRLRQDAETFDFDESNSKRQKPHTCILSLLDEEEENEEFSAMLTTLQQELSSTAATADNFDFESAPEEEDGAQKAEEDEGVKSVMRHLLEASDDELGIPNNNSCNVGREFDEAINLNFFDNGVWEFDDVAAFTTPFCSRSSSCSSLFGN